MRILWQKILDKELDVVGMFTIEYSYELELEAIKEEGIEKRFLWYKDWNIKKLFDIENYNIILVMKRLWKLI